MTFIRALATIGRDTGDPADSMTNTWHFDTDDNVPRVDEAGFIFGILEGFYQSQEIRLPADYYDTPINVKFYDLEDPVPRLPFHEDNIAMTFTTSIPTLPPEVSMVLSFHAEFVSGVNNARRRGRLYLPTMIGTPQIVGGQYRWNQSAVDSVVAAATAVRDNGIVGITWAVFSPTTLASGGTLDEAFNDVTGGWVDLDPDIQRRRGPASGAPRTTF